MLLIRLTPWIVTIAMIVSVFVGCEALREAPIPTPTEPGAALVDAGENATPEDVIGAVSIVAPAVLGPWGLVLVAVARAWYTKRQGNKAVRSVQPVIDGLTSEERAVLLNQDPATKRFIREARGKSFKLPI